MTDALTLSPLERRILAIIQADFPLVPDPYADIAHQVGCTPEEAYDAVNNLRRRGIIRRLGGSLVARELGYQSTLVACRVHPEQLDEAAHIAGQFSEVTHSYARNGAYNLWFTVIADSEGRVAQIMQAVRHCPGVEAVETLPALRTFKLRVVFPFAQEVEHV